MKYKYIILILALISIILIPLIYKIHQIYISKSHIIYLRALKAKWKFSPDVIKVPVGETWYLHIYNEDNYDHGFFIEKLGINTNLPARQEVVIPVISKEKGTFSFMCSVICGAGHYRMVGQLDFF